MNQFQTVNIKDFNVNPFTLIGNEWMLITAAKKDGTVNTMTASWGGLGVMWNTNVAYAVVRPTRYTKEFMDAADSFSLSFLDHKTYAKELAHLGSVSGRDEDKIAKMNLTIEHQDRVPFFAEASKVLICRKMFVQPMQPESFVDPQTDAKFYPLKDYHTLYIAAIEGVLERNGVGVR